ncbi:hypothetical protein KKH81_00925 [Patescibacteria group bacterium]|nr:hypothetical protein [Patescibacteria group bacterium]
MQHDPQFIRSLVSAWRNAYGDDLTDDQIVDRFDEILNLYVRLREFDRTLGEQPRYDRPQQILLYILAGGQLLTMANLDDRCFQLQVPRGYAEDGETLDDAALRIADETEVGNCSIVKKLGTDGDTTIDRHFYLIETNASARKRSWVIDHGNRSAEYSWTKLGHADDLFEDHGTYLSHLRHAA